MKTLGVRRERATRALGVTLALGLAACATSPFQRAGNADDVAAAVARSHPPAATGRALAFLVLAGAGGARLAEYDLAASRVLWTQPADVTTRVEVGGSVLVHGSKGTTPNGELVGRDLAPPVPVVRSPLRLCPRRRCAVCRHPLDHHSQQAHRGAGGL